MKALVVSATRAFLFVVCIIPQGVVVCLIERRLVVKVCNKCRKERPLTEFKADPRNKGGLTGICTPCQKEWQRSRREARRNGTAPLKVVTEKTCNKCEQTKSIAEFYKDSGCSDGHSTLCKPCRNQSMGKWRDDNRERYNKNMRAFRASNPDKAKDVDLRRCYGIGLDDYKRMWAEQKGVCAKCSKPQKGVRPLCVDHDHETGVVRQLLCYKCNRDQHVVDNTEAFQRSVEYRTKHRVQKS